MAWWLRHRAHHNIETVYLDNVTFKNFLLMNEEEIQDAFDRAMDAMEARLEAIYPDGLVSYSAFSEDENGIPIDNLDEVAVTGRVRFVCKHDPFFGEGEDYRSDVLENPTWLQVVGCANDMVATTGDEHHIYLEELSELGEEESVMCYELWMGS